MADARDGPETGAATPFQEPNGQGHRSRLPGSESSSYSTEAELPLLGRPLRPLVDMVARI